MKKGEKADTRSPMASPRSTKQYLKAWVVLLIAWNAWFVIKVLINRFSADREDVYSEISSRVSLALSSTTNTVMALYGLFRAVLLSVLRWSDVALPFVQDAAYVARHYVSPFLLTRVITPVSRWLSPVPTFLLHHGRSGWSWFNTNVPLEYKIQILFITILLMNKRINDFFKFQILAFLATVFVFTWVQPVLTNPSVKVILFVLTPAVLAIDAIAKKDATKGTNKLGNLLLYFTLSPALWLGELYLSVHVSGSTAISLVYNSVIYSFLLTFMYFLNSGAFAGNFRAAVSNFERVGGPVKWLKSRVLEPALARAFFAVVSKYPAVGTIPHRIRSVKESLTSHVLTLTFSNGNVGILKRILTVFKSTPILLLLAFAVMSVLAAVYYTYASVSKLLYYAVWPWWFSESTKTSFYNRKEEFRGQLAFTLLFLALEVFIAKNEISVLSFFLNLFHLPLVLCIKLLPVQAVRVLSAVASLLPSFIMKAAGARGTPSRPGTPVEGERQQFVQMTPNPGDGMSEVGTPAARPAEIDVKPVAIAE